MFSCCGLNGVLDRKNAFLKSMDNAIGQSIEENYHPTIVKVIKEWEGRFGENIQVYKNSDDTVTFIEARSSDESCVVSRVINRKDWKILSWEFYNNKDDCETDVFNCTP